MREIARLQFITRGSSGSAHLAGAVAALRAGIDWIQLRMKDVPRAEVRPVARELSEWCHRADAVLIINDDPELAVEVGADGAHVGVSDMPVMEARRILGPEKFLGATAHNERELESLVGMPVEYIGIGPFGPSTTKQDLAPVLGLEGISALVRFWQGRGAARGETMAPLIGVGGITPADVPGLCEAGVFGVAMSSALAAPKPGPVVESLQSMLSRMEK